MKSFMKEFLFTTLFLSASVINISAQTEWTKYNENPVLQKGPEEWDIIALGQPTVLWENDTFKMWYAGVGADVKARICYAVSSDGIHWTKHSEPVLDLGGPGEWDRGWLDTPEVVKAGDTYLMMYYGDTLQLPAEISSAMGVAFSEDGIHWTKSVSNPVFTKSGAGHWDGTWVESPAILYDESSEEYRMWYNGADTSTWKLQIGYATSPDGESWTRYAGNPVLATSDFGGYDDIWLGTPAVIYHNDTFLMWYASTSTNSYNGATGQFDTVNICYATSPDGENWTKDPDNPLFHTFTAPRDSLIDSKGPWAPDVVYHDAGETFYMWYETEAGICLATAPENEVNRLETTKVNRVRVFPNPFRSEIYIQGPAENYSYRLFDIVGHIYREGYIVGNSIDGLNDFPPGQYILLLKSDSDSRAIKLVKY